MNLWRPRVIRARAAPYQYHGKKVASVPEAEYGIKAHLQSPSHQRRRTDRQPRALAGFLPAVRVWPADGVTLDFFVSTF